MIVGLDFLRENLTESFFGPSQRLSISHRNAQLTSGDNLMVVQGGGPSPVLNATLASIVEESGRHAGIGKVYGARAGVLGLIRSEVADLSRLSHEELQRLRMSPGAALGSSRAMATGADLERVVGTLRQLNVRYLLFCGGNGTMTGAQAIAQWCRYADYEARVIGVPKTIDNDIAQTDRCPGYATAARYIAQSTRDLGMDIRALPQPVSILETMGRGVGWVAAAAAAAKRDVEDAPHLVYIPEVAFEMGRFLADLDRVVTKQGWAVVVVSEGIRDGEGRLVYQTADPSQMDALRRPLTGGVGQFLAETVARELKFRCRSEKPGLLGRASMLHASERDLADAELVGRQGVSALMRGETGKMVSLCPLGGDAGWKLVSLEQVSGVEREIPQEWTDEGPLAVNDGFLHYVRPLIGDLLEYHAPLSFRPAEEERL